MAQTDRIYGLGTSVRNVNGSILALNEWSQSTILCDAMLDAVYDSVICERHSDFESGVLAEKQAPGFGEITRP